MKVVFFLFLFGCAGSSLLPGFSLAVASEGYSSLQCVGCSSQWLLLVEHGLWGVWASLVAVCGLQGTGLTVVAQGLRCSAACGIFPDQGSNLCHLHWPADSSPLSHQGNPYENNLDLMDPWKDAGTPRGLRVNHIVRTAGLIGIWVSPQKAPWGISIKRNVIGHSFWGYGREVVAGVSSCLGS